MWEIRENEDYRFGRRDGFGMKDYDKSYEEGYKHGYEDGYSKAMKETFYSHERSSYREDPYSERRGMR